MAQCSLPCLYTRAALPSGRVTAVTVTKPMISMQFLLRAMIPKGTSSGTPGGQTGATMAAATLPSVTGIEAWVGVSRRTMVESQGQSKSIYGNARRKSVAGFVVPLTEETAVETVRPWYVRLLQCVRGI